MWTLTGGHVFTFVDYCCRCIQQTIIIIVNTIINVGEIPANVISYLGLKINTNQFLKSLFYR